MNPEPKGCVNGYWMPTFVVDEGILLNRDALIETLKTQGVDARVFFWPLSSTSLGGRKAFKKPYISESIHLKALNLPSYHHLCAKDSGFISSIVRSWIEGES